MEMAVLARQFGKNVEGIQKANHDWDLKSLEKYKRAVQDNLEEIKKCSEPYLSSLDNDLQQIVENLRNPDYHKQIEEALRERKILVKGAFPKYTIGPLRLEFAIKENQSHVRLSFSRKTLKTFAFNPKTLAKWVEKHYQMIIKGGFDEKRFAKDLLGAYEYATRVHYDKIRWNVAVSLEEIYKLLTMRAACKLEYTKEHFIFDIAQFRKGPLSFDGYQFEFSYSRDASRSFLLIDENGREERLSSLLIRKMEGEPVNDLIARRP